MSSALIDRIDTVKKDVEHQLRQIVVDAAQDETEIEAESVVALLGQAGRDVDWFEKELNRCRDRLQASRTLEQIEGERKQLPGATAEHSKAVAELQETIERHKRELKAARHKVASTSMASTSLGSRLQRRQREAEELLFRTVGNAHRSQLAAAASEAERIQASLRELQENPPEDRSGWARNALQRLENEGTLDPEQRVEEREREVAELREVITQAEEEQQKYAADLQQLRDDFAAAESLVAELKQQSLDPLEAF